MPYTKLVKHEEALTKRDVVKAAVKETVAGAALGGVSGLIGRWGVSFFNPGVASAVGSAGTLFAMGAIAAPLIMLPSIIANCLIEESDILRKSPHMREFLKDTARFALQVAGVAAAAAMLSTPIGPAVICMMVIPAIFYALKSICNVVNALFENEPAAVSATPVAAM